MRVLSVMIKIFPEYVVISSNILPFGEPLALKASIQPLIQNLQTQANNLTYFSFNLRKKIEKFSAIKLLYDQLSQRWDKLDQVSW